MNRPSKWLAVLLALAWVLMNAAPAPADDAASRAAHQALDCGVPEDTVARILAAMLDGRLTRDDGARILDPLVRACDEDLPPGPLAEKADEGLSKSVSADNLARALAQRLEDLRFARGLVAAKDPKGGFPVDALMGLVEGLEAGLAREALAGLVARHPRVSPDMLATAARVWGYLVRAGMSEQEGLRVIDEGLRLEGLTPGWLQFPRLAGLALNKGVEAAAICDAALAALRAGKGPADAAARLGLTSRRLDAPPAAGR